MIIGEVIILNNILKTVKIARIINNQVYCNMTEAWIGLDENSIYRLQKND